MILIPFIENAFKYAYNTGKLPVIDIVLQCNEYNLLFTCQNYWKKDKSGYEMPGGVGLENAKRRLALLYPGKHELTIFEEEPVFRVELNIQLT
jgi:sensor histidine kinase YesM